jgi:hypothetical protein
MWNRSSSNSTRSRQASHVCGTGAAATVAEEVDRPHICGTGAAATVAEEVDRPHVCGTGAAATVAEEVDRSDVCGTGAAATVAEEEKEEKENTMMTMDKNDGPRKDVVKSEEKVAPVLNKISIRK